MWITSGGFADIFTVFAKVDGEAFTAFIVERAFPGVSTGREEHKLGLHGSSTTPLILQDVRVPAENVLGEVGKGHKVAFNVLNYGRFKLGAMCSGGARFVIGEAARYASQRRQFGRRIADFGAIRHKLGEMIVRQYAVESMLYRIAGLLDISMEGRHDGDALLSALEQFAIEASIVKVAASEALDYVVDENVQIHGGNGFVRDYDAERHYRDARVNRIFEGTNEINRLLIPTMLVRRSQEHLETAAVQTAAVEAGFSRPDTDPLDAMKSAARMVLSTAVTVFADKLGDEQHVLLPAADILIDVFAADSVKGRAAEGLHQAAATVYLNDAADRVEVATRQCSRRNAPRRRAGICRRQGARDVQPHTREDRASQGRTGGGGTLARAISLWLATVQHGATRFCCWLRSLSHATQSRSRYPTSPRGVPRRTASCGRASRPYPRRNARTSLPCSTSPSTPRIRYQRC